jgi:hypothetical protein
LHWPSKLYLLAFVVDSSTYIVVRFFRVCHVNILLQYLAVDRQWGNLSAYLDTIAAGAAALLLSMDPDLSVPEVKALLLASALPSPYLQGKVASGGHLHIGRAVAALRPLVEYFAPGG